MRNSASVKHPTYNYKALYAACRDRGYTRNATLRKLKEMYGHKRVENTQRKVEGSNLTYKDIIKISNTFELTPTEFLRTFFKDCFKETPSGKVVFRVSDKVIKKLDETGWLPEQEQAYRDAIKRTVQMKRKVQKELGNSETWWLSRKEALRKKEEEEE